MPIKRYLLNPLLELSRQGRLAGVMLITATVLSMLLSNGVKADQYLKLWETEIGFSFLHKSLLHWINDGLMVIFFLMVGLEIKRELVKGELSSVKQAILPVFAAAGGMLLPGIIYVLVNARSGHYLHGWAIPTATDIAFSLGIISLLGKRVPVSVKIFLAALAIIDDLGAILIIAFFYAQGLHLGMLAAGLGVFALMLLMNRLKLVDVRWYLVPGLFLWYFILKSGIHPTIAGVLAAFAIPLESGECLEEELTRPVNYMILPLFALANTAIPLSMDMATAIFSTLSIGIILGLFIGKPVGIALFSYLPRWLRLSEGPANLNFKLVLGMGFTAGIGFTMSIFISGLAFTDPEMVNIAKLAIIAGSILAAITGLIILAGNPVPSEDQETQ